MKEHKPAKLTLTVDPAIIRKAKSFATAHHTSVSGLVESYLKQLVEAETNKEETSDPLSWPPITRKLHASLRDVDTGADYRALRDEYLIQKH